MNFIAVSDDTVPRVADSGRKFLVRLVSAAVLAPLTLGIIYVGGWPFTLLVVCAGALMSLEWVRLTDGASRSVTLAVHVCGILPWIVVAGLQHYIAAILGLTATALAWLVYSYFGGVRRPWPALGVLWLGVPCVALIWLRSASEVGFSVTLLVFVLAWSSDTLAYCFGRTIGGPKMAPRVSPNKTWAGLIGAVVGAAGAGAAVATIAHWPSVLYTTLVSGCLGAVGQLGDVAESAVKRRFAVKDSGSLIPGHGGLLDRVDALLFVVLAVAGLALIDYGSALPW